MSIFSKRKHGFDVPIALPDITGAPAGVANRDFWIDHNSGKLAFRFNGVTVLVPLPAEIAGAITVGDTGTLDLSLVGGVITGVVLDSPTVGGMTAAAIQTAVINAISNGAGVAYDTLIEIQNLLQADDTLQAGLTSGLAVRARFFAGAIPNGSPAGTVNHGLGLANIHDFTFRTFVAASGVEEEYDVIGATNNTVTVTDETGGNIPAGRRIFLTAGV